MPKVKFMTSEVMSSETPKNDLEKNSTGDMKKNGIYVKPQDLQDILNLVLS